MQGHAALRSVTDGPLHISLALLFRIARRSLADGGHQLLLPNLGIVSHVKNVGINAEFRASLEYHLVVIIAIPLAPSLRAALPRAFGYLNILADSVAYCFKKP